MNSYSTAMGRLLGRRENGGGGEVRESGGN